MKKTRKTSSDALLNIREMIDKVAQFKGDSKMVKRKAAKDAAVKNNKTPKENLMETEFSSEFAQGEDVAKAANRNSKKGRQGRG